MKWASTTFSEFIDDAQSPDEDFATDGATTTQVVDVSPGTVQSRRQAALDFVGYQTVKQAKSPTKNKLVNYLTRTPPMPYVDDPRPELNEANRPMFCTGIPRGIGRGVGVKNPRWNATDYDLYRMWLTFRALPYPLLPDKSVIATDPANPLVGFPDEGEALALSQPRYVQRVLDFASRMPSVIGSAMYFVDDAAQVKTGIKDTLYVNDNNLGVTYLWFSVPKAAFPVTVAFDQLNTVNSISFDSFEPGTLLFCGCRAIPRVGPLGDDLLDVQYLFKAIKHFNPTLNQAFGWNSVLRNAPPNIPFSYYPISGDGTSTGAKLYASKDPRLLFQPPQP